VEFARTMIEQAKAAEAERARVAAEAAEAEAEAEAEAAMEAEAALERLQIEQEAAALTLSVKIHAMRLQQMHAQLGVVTPAAPAPQAEAKGALCVVCMDAPKNHVMRPCMHMCTCEACTQQLVEQVVQSCPVCREPIERVFA